MTNQDIASYILSYMNRNLSEPHRKWVRKDFSNRSYSRWACYRIAELLMDNPIRSFDDIIDDYEMQMMSYFVCTKYEAFSVAISTAEELRYYVNYQMY